MTSVLRKWVIAALFIFSSLCTEKVMYLYEGPDKPLQNLNLTGIRNSPIYIKIDCKIKDCKNYKVTQFPTLIYWKGVGSAFQKIIPPTQQAFRAHMAAKQIGVMNKFRRWVQDWSKPQTFVYTIMFAFFLYSVFNVLFSPPKKQQQMLKKHSQNLKKIADLKEQ